MTALNLSFQVIIYALGLWLGLYLLARNPGQAPLRLAGIGVVCYALGWGFDLLSRYSPESGTGALLVRLRWSLAFLPALFWSGVMLYLLPEDSLLRGKLLLVWGRGLAPAVGLCYLLGLFSDWLFDTRSARPVTGAGYFLLVVLVILPLLATLVLAWKAIPQAQPNNLTGLLLLVLVMFGMGTGLLLVPLDWFLKGWG